MTSNRWLKSATVPGRLAETGKPWGFGRIPRLGHEEGAHEQLRFYVSIKDAEDIAMLVIPEAFRPVMKQWLVLKPPRVFRLSTNKWCELWVKV